MSRSEATQTFPSIEDEPIYIAFEEFDGTGGCFGFRFPGELPFEPDRWCAAVVLCPELILVEASALEVGNGGGKGDMDNEEIEAVWA